MNPLKIAHHVVFWIFLFTAPGVAIWVLGV